MKFGLSIEYEKQKELQKLENNPTLDYLQKMTELTKNIRRDSDLYYKSFEHFVLENGRAFEAQTLPEPFCFAKAGECFKNAYQLILTNPALRYVEGYATAVIPTLHAWVIDEHDRVIDNTWNLAELGSNNGFYFGVVFPFEFVVKTAYTRGKYGIIDNLEQRFPLLREKFNAENLK